jgi:SNF2 family DNA or RNA helicase
MLIGCAEMNNNPYDILNLFNRMLASRETQKPAAKPAAVAAPAAAGPLKAKLEDKLSDLLDRKLNSKELAYIKNVRLVHKSAIYSRSLYTGYLHALIDSACFSDDYLDIYPECPRDEVEFWHYLRPVVEQRGGIVPPCMNALAAGEELQKRIRNYQRDKEITHWKHLVSLSSNALEYGDSAPDLVDFRLILCQDKAVLDWKTDGQESFQELKSVHCKRLSDASRTSGIKVAAGATALWNLAVHGLEVGRGTLRYMDDYAKDILNTLLRMPELADRIFNENRHPLVFAAEPLAWKMDEQSEGEDPHYSLQLLKSDGQPAPAFRLVLKGKPTLYLTRDAVYPGPFPLNQQLRLDMPNRIPAPALEDETGIHFLLKLGMALPKRLRDRVHHTTMTVVVDCEIDLFNDYVKSEFIAIDVTAESDDGRKRECYNARSWEAATGNGRKKSDAVVYIYDRSRQTAFQSKFEELGARWDYGSRRWQLRMTKNAPEKLAEWLRSLPPDVRVNLKGDLATLVADPVKASVRLECTEVEIDWFDLKVAISAPDTDLNEEELKILLNAKGRLVRLPEKGWRRMQLDTSEEENQRLARMGLNAKDFTSEPQRFHALQLADNATDGFLPKEQTEQIHRRVDELKTRVTPAVPDAIQALLRPYQVEGFHFLAYLSANHFGGILADDMGLGKTVQTLAWLAWHRLQPEALLKPSLVVCPKSVMDNWRSEVDRFLPSLRVKLWDRGENADGLPDFLKELDLLVINYAQLRNLCDPLTLVNWHTVILDEGQFIKNPTSQTSVAACGLKASQRLVLSGTPIENRLLDLWSLMNFAMPGVLGNRTQFARRYDVKDDPFARRRLSARVRPFLLRRTKSQVATELPDRIEEDIYCEMEGDQKTLYRAEFKRAQQLLLGMKTQKEFAEQQFHFLVSLLRLRQICCHPGLVNEEDHKAESAKLNALMELLEPLMEEGSKVLVFSQFITMLDLIRKAIKAKQWKQFYLAGDTENRGELVKEFQESQGSSVFLISLKAGGFGLNLTAASYVVLFDPWWNPAVESQAIDRTHRIGQKSKVIAYRLLIKNSIEEKIRALQKTKAAIAEDILGEENFAKTLTLDDFRFLFRDDPDEKR